MSIGRWIYGICIRSTYSEVDIRWCYLITKPTFYFVVFKPAFITAYKKKYFRENRIPGDTAHSQLKGSQPPLNKGQIQEWKVALLEGRMK